MKQDWEIYRDTGILGAYRPEQVILRRSEDGGVETLLPIFSLTAASVSKLNPGQLAGYFP